VARATASFTAALWSSTSLRGELLDLRVLRLRRGELAAVDVDVVRGQRDVGDLRIGRAREMAEVIGRESHLPPLAVRCSGGAMIPALQTRMCKGRIQGR